MILVHDNDLGFISGAVSLFFYLWHYWPHPCGSCHLIHCQNTSGIMRLSYSRFSMVGVLQSYGPIDPVLNRCEELLPRNENRSGIEASIVTVATLSHDLFEAPCQNQNNPECPQLTDTINGTDNEISQSVFQENAVPQSSDLSRSTSVSITDGDLLNDAVIPLPTVSSHNVLRDPDRPLDSSMSSPQSVSQMDTPV